MSDVPSNLIPTRVTQLPVAPVADENSLMMIVYQGNNYQIRVGDLLSVAGVPTSRQVIAGTGLVGGGQLSSNVTLSIAPGGVGSSQLASSGVTPGTYGTSTTVPVLTVDATGRVTAATSAPVAVSGFVPETRQVIAGTGLTGGGALNSNVTLNANFSNSTPLDGNNAGSPGVSTSIARADHQHPAVDLSDDDEVDGILGLSNGGTARSLVMQPGAVVWSGADGLYVSAAGALGQVLVSGGTGAPSWGSSVILSPTPANQVFAGPTSGPNANPTFRALVNDDVPAALSGKALTNSTINSTVLGGVTPAAVTGTTITATAQFNGSGAGLTSVPNSALNNSSVTFNGVTVSLGASGTLTANTTNPLTIGTGLSGTSFNGGSAVTIAIDSSVVTLTGTQTLTGKSISGSTNTLTNIPNSALSNSSVTLGSTSVALGGSTATLSGLTSVSVTQDPTSALQLATKQYVDAVAEGLHVHASCSAATTATLASITGGTVTYNNGTAGVGATLTLSSPLTTLDGYSLVNGNRVLVKNEATQAHNGIYTWATGGTVLTRATDFDTSTEIASGDFTFVTYGTLYANTGWVQIDPVAVVGTDPIVWVQFSGAGTYTAGTGLTLTGSQFSLTAPVTAALGGTGQTSYAAGDLLYASGSSALSKLAIGTNGQVLSSTGTAPQYVDQSTLSVGSATNATNATNTAITANSTNATNYLTFVSATTGNLGQLVNSSITCNPSTGALTGGISGGTF